MSTESDDSMEEVTVTQYSDEEIAAWSTKVVDVHETTYKTTDENIEMSAVERNARVQTKQLILCPPKFTYGQNLSNERKDERIGTETCKGQSNLAVKRKFEESPVSSLSDDDSDNGEKEEKEKNVEVDQKEGEVLILKIDCVMHIFSDRSSKWAKKTSGTLFLYDYEDSTLGLQSRVVVHSRRSSHIMLNSKIWSGMIIKKHNERTVHLTALDKYGQSKVFLLSVAPVEIDELFGAVRDRVEKQRTDMSMNYLTRYATSASAAKRRALDRRNGDEDHIDPAELD